MSAKDPEEELQEFLAAQPSWLRKILQLDYRLSREEWTEMNQSDWWQSGGKVEGEYNRLLRRVPNRLREHIEKMKKHALADVPKLKRGRPRKDMLAEKAVKLKQGGKSYAQVSAVLNKSGAETTAQSVRKLIKTRTSQPRTKI